jgi:hypothetical protein
MKEQDQLLYFLHMQTAAGDAPVTRIPKGFVSGGPCPHCHRIVNPHPDGFTFAAQHGDDAAAANKTAGLVVCTNCAKPLFFEKPGEYQGIARKVLRELPRATQNFIKREQELIAAMKKAIN